MSGVASQLRTVAVLCAAKRSVYKEIEGCDVYDIDRDAMTFPGGMPVVAHPPCRLWSAYCAHQANADNPTLEKMLGRWCVNQVATCGGVVEQPAHSRLWEAMHLPKPGWTSNRDSWSMELPRVDLQKPKQSVVLARLRRALRGCLRIASALVNSAACPKIRSLPAYAGKEPQGNRDEGSKEKLRGKGESLSQKPLPECGITSPAAAQQKDEANPKSDYAPRSPIMVGATNFKSSREMWALGRVLKSRIEKRLSATQRIEGATTLGQDGGGLARDSEQGGRSAKSLSGEQVENSSKSCSPDCKSAGQLAVTHALLCSECGGEWTPNCLDLYRCDKCFLAAVQSPGNRQDDGVLSHPKARIGKRLKPQTA